MNSKTRFLMANAMAVLTAMVLGLGAVQAAENDARALREALTLINQEQQAVFQQFQMIQQLRRANAEPVLPPVGGGPPGNYDDVVAAKKSQGEREEAYARELEQEKRPIMEGLRRLRQETPRSP